MSLSCPYSTKSGTSPINVMNNSDEINELNESIIDEMDEILNSVLSLNNVVVNKPTVNKSKIKYSCPDNECNLIIWGKPELFVICGECNEVLVC